MPELTPEQIDEARGDAGDCCGPDYALSIPQLQALFDNAARANGDVDKLKVYILRRRWAKAQAEAGRVTDFGTSVDRANMDHIEDLLRYWEKVTGLVPAATLTTGSLDLGIDAVCESEWE